MLCWADGGWDHHRCIGFASVRLEGAATPLVQPVFDPLALALGAELRALALAIMLTPNDPAVEIRMDSRTVLDLVAGRTRCTVLECVPHVRWARRMLGERQLVWVPREQNQAHVMLSSLFDGDDTWHDYELGLLRERKQTG